MVVIKNKKITRRDGGIDGNIYWWTTYDNIKKPSAGRNR